jgi:hypothetical protein
MIGKVHTSFDGLRKNDHQKDTLCVKQHKAYWERHCEIQKKRGPKYVITLSALLGKPIYTFPCIFFVKYCVISIMKIAVLLHKKP